MDLMDGVSITHSPYSCQSCRNAKRRCDRTYPKCTLCAQKGMQCDYPYCRKERRQCSSGARRVTSQASTNETNVRPKARRDDFSEPNASDILASRFLDPDVFSLLQLEIPRVEVPIPKSVTDLVGTVSDIQNTLGIFFDTIYTWMPIISRKQLFTNLPNYLNHRRAELFLLVMSMKLCCSHVTTARTTVYRITKQFYFDTECSGILSIQILQAGILISLYELGHAIYPAALLSIGSCARYAAALEIDQSIAPQTAIKVPWIELEECRRVWWSILVLDRFLNLCNPKRHLVTADPSSDCFLPVEDIAWDAGTSQPSDALTLDSSSSSHIGRFARFAQTSHLLTQALCSVAKDPGETLQLRRTILALANLSQVEGAMRQWQFCTQIAVCYSAILLLENPSLLLNANGSVAGPISTEASSALDTALDLISFFLMGPDSKNCDGVSPFLIHFIYKAASVYLEVQYIDPAQSTAERVNKLKGALHLLNHRWLAAGAYLSLLKKHEVSLLVQDE